jgi:hypothetical protein
MFFFAIGSRRAFFEIFQKSELESPEVRVREGEGERGREREGERERWGRGGGREGGREGGTTNNRVRVLFSHDRDTREPESSCPREIPWSLKVLVQGRFLGQILKAPLDEFSKVST